MWMCTLESNPILHMKLNAAHSTGIIEAGLRHSEKHLVFTCCILFQYVLLNSFTTG